MILVSACLSGINCRYDGRNACKEEIMRLVREGKAIPVCPEQLGGCPTPRPAAEIRGGTGADVLDGRARVINLNGEDVTQNFIRGAEETLLIARMVKAKKAILKSKSPSCGFGVIRDGTFTGGYRKGNGVTAELLAREGIVIADENGAP